MYRYTECGLSNVYLSNGYEIHDSAHYGRAVSIHKIRDLHKAIGLDLVARPGRLGSEEIRFLRHEMDLSQRALGRLLGAAEITVRKWEASDSRISPSNDRLLRACYLSFANAGKAYDLIRKLSDLDKSLSSKPKRLVFKSNRRWQRAAA